MTFQSLIFTDAGRGAGVRGGVGFTYFRFLRHGPAAFCQRRSARELESGTCELLAFWLLIGMKAGARSRKQYELLLSIRPRF
jgi:hypothetical protein